MRQDAREHDRTTALYEECYRTHLRKVIYYAKCYLGDAETAKDIGYEVFLTVWEKRQHIDFTIDMLPFLLVLTRNKSLNKLKQRQNEYKYRTRAALEYERNRAAFKTLSETTSVKLHSAEIAGLVEEACRQMPEKVRDTFMKNRYMDMKYSEIAEQENVSVKAVEKRMMSALRILRVKLKDYLPK